MKGFAHDLFPSGRLEVRSGSSDVWITPDWILRSLGRFDLDPCSNDVQPWPTAERMVCLPDDGLSIPWDGRVWLNPPYGPRAKVWIERLAGHGNGIALLFARTETRMWATIWERADAILFVSGRIAFHRPDGSVAEKSGAPSALIAWGGGECSGAVIVRDSGRTCHGLATTMKQGQTGRSSPVP